MNEQEQALVKACVAADSRERYLTLLASKKSRIKLRRTLAHTFVSYLDMRYV